MGALDERAGDVAPGEFVPRVPHGLRRTLRDVEPEARLARTFLDDEEPAWVLLAVDDLPAACLLRREIEAEEVDVGIDLGLVQRRLHQIARRVGRLLLGEGCELARLRLVGGAAARALPLGAVR